MNVLVIAAHPDDEVLGAGATIARHARQGDTVSIAILGEGITSRYSSREQAQEEDLTRLNQSARKAAQILGCHQVITFNLPDNRFDQVDLLDVTKLVEKVVEQTKPELVYTHFWGDLNIDHVVTARATLTACRPLENSSVRRLLSYEVPSATGWGLPNQPFVPDVFINVENTLTLKLEAMNAYASEARAFPHPRSSEALTARAHAWGSMAGLKAAEPFKLVREIIS